MTDEIGKQNKRTVAEIIEDAFVMGWRKGVEAYAVWKDGQQLVGIGRFTLSDAQKSAAEDAKPFFEQFMSHQRAVFDGDEPQ